MSHKSWMKTVPTENCDILMTFAGQSTAHTNTHRNRFFCICEDLKLSPLVFSLNLSDFSEHEPLAILGHEIEIYSYFHELFSSLSGGREADLSSLSAQLYCFFFFGICL